MNDALLTCNIPDLAVARRRNFAVLMTLRAYTARSRMSNTPRSAACNTPSGAAARLASYRTHGWRVTRPVPA